MQKTKTLKEVLEEGKAKTMAKIRKLSAERLKLLDSTLKKDQARFDRLQERIDELQQEEFDYKKLINNVDD